LKSKTEHLPPVIPTPDIIYNITPKINVCRDKDWKKLQQKPIRGKIIQKVILFGCKEERKPLML
jgi:hypothetical protein